MPDPTSAPPPKTMGEWWAARPTPTSTRAWLESLVPGATAVGQAVDWFKQHVPTISPETQGRIGKLEADLAAHEATQRTRPTAPAFAQPAINVAKQTAGTLASQAGSYFEPDPTLKGLGEYGKGVIERRNRTGDPLLDLALAPQRLVGKFAIDQAIDASTGGGAALNADLPFGKVLGGAAHLAGVPGFFSRVDRIAEGIPKRGIHPNKLKSLLRSGASTEEVAYRKLDELLASKGDALVTPAELQAHLAANPAPFPEVTRRGAATPLARPPFEEWLGNAHMNLDEIGATEEAALRELHARPAVQTHPPTKYHNYTLPGGESYRETLLTLPSQVNQRIDAVQREMSDVGHQMDLQGVTTIDSPYDSPVSHEHRALADRYSALQQELNQLTAQSTPYQSSHWPNVENPLVHSRSKERVLPTGERGRFLEEVQSDWHQAGKRSGYQGAPDPRTSQRLAQLEQEIAAADDEIRGHYREADAHRNAMLDQLREQTRLVLPPDFAHLTNFNEALRGGQPAVDAWRTARETVYSHPAVREHARRQEATEELSRLAAASRNNLEAERNTLQRRATAGVPDAPFKETWPDLALKQQLLETAHHPDLSWLGFTSGQTQASRYDLSKQISELSYNGVELKARDPDGFEVVRHLVLPEKLPDYIGKEAAQKLLAAPAHDLTGVRTLSGVDLEMGGEGMKSFYDQLLPKRLEKILKPFGGTVERAPLSGRTKAQIDAEMDALTAATPEMTPNYRDAIARLQAERDAAIDEPAWIARLSPEAKARIQQEGLPLMSLAPAAVAGGAAAAAATSGDEESSAGPAALLSGVAPITLGGRRPLGSLAAGLKYLGEPGRYALRSSVLDRLHEAYQTGRALPGGHLWSSAQQDPLARAFGDPQLAHLWSRMFGATSAGTDVRKNTKESVATLAHALHTGRSPFTMQTIPGEFKRNKAGDLLYDGWGQPIPVQGTTLYGQRLTNAPSKVPNLNRILGYEPMSGDKVEAMGQFVWGDPRTPLDRHVLWGAGAEKDKFAEEAAALKALMEQSEGQVLGTSKVYRRYEDALREGLQGFDPKRDYNALFGDTWEGIRALKKEPYQGGPADLLRSQGLLDPGAMADPERLIYQLQQNPGVSWIGQPATPASRIIF